jgi:hypothetical protein
MNLKNIYENASENMFLGAIIGPMVLPRHKRKGSGAAKFVFASQPKRIKMNNFGVDHLDQFFLNSLI